VSRTHAKGERRRPVVGGLVIKDRDRSYLPEFMNKLRKWRRILSVCFDATLADVLFAVLHSRGYQVEFLAEEMG
jgi:hypothetical protein